MTQIEEAAPEKSESRDSAAPADNFAPEQQVAPAARPARRTGFLGGLVGGVIAAALGFAAAQVYPKGWPFAVSADLAAKVDQQAADIHALSAQIKQLTEATTPDAQIADRVAELEAKMSAPVDLAPVEGRIATLESRLSAIEALPADGSGASSAAIAALRAEVAAIKTGGPGNAALTSLTQDAETRLKAAEDRTVALQAETEAMVAKARARTALGQLMAAMDSGAPYAGLLPDLGKDVPEALSGLAAGGVPTLVQLRESFPDAARAALEASLEADMGATWSDRIGSFLRSQTGARSLQPREGGDPDAVLSRAEARLAEGDLQATLTELDGLPDAGKAAIADWRSRADQRLAAIAALSALSAQIDG